MGSESANEKIIPSGRSGKPSWRRGYLNWALKDEQPVLTGGDSYVQGMNLSLYPAIRLSMSDSSGKDSTLP